jgi:hypothetical protein
MTRWWRIVREPTVDEATLGAFYREGAFHCWSLEDVIREIPGRPVLEWKVDGKTAIPAGVYQVRLSLSPKFDRTLPELVDVPGFKGIRIHRGNYPRDTEGCPLVGFARAHAAIVNSAPAESTLVTALLDAERAGDQVKLVIENPPVFV